MKIFTLLLILVLIPATAAQDKKEELISAAFRNSGINGTFVLYDLRNDNHVTNDKERANRGFLPASTFKIFNSLAALEAGAVKNEEEIIKWDSIPRSIGSWNKDHNLRSAIKHSVVWFYQEMARRVGVEKMQSYLDKCSYGNRDITEGIDLFWLQGNFRITPMEQIDFLKKLHSGSLPFAERNINIVKDIMIKERKSSYVIYGKTGWAARTNPQTGWYIGFVEKSNDTYFFALNIDILKDEDAAKREELTYSILSELKILEE